MGFSVCVCVSTWISGWVSGFVCILGLCFGRGFRPLSAFRAGFLLVVLNLLVSIWVAHISTLFFFCFSNLGFAHISTHFFCSSSLVLDGFWSWWWRCGCAVVSRLNSAAEPGFLYVCI